MIFRIITLIIIFAASCSYASLLEECSNKKIKAYTKEGCIYCIKLKNLLQETDTRFDEVEITGNKIIYSWLVSYTGSYTVPYIFIDDIYVGGYTDFIKICRK